MQTVSGEHIAECALSGGYIGTPYSQLDCQGFVEQVLKDSGVRKPNGACYNWKGSNSMWRNYIGWRGTISECLATYGKIPLGAFVFRVKHDGGEKDRGYNDNLGNASHVGLYVKENASLPCMDSQPTGGVQFRKLDVFTHVGLMTMIDYGQTDDVLMAVHTIRDDTSTDREYLTALEVLTKHFREVKI